MSHTNRSSVAGLLIGLGLIAIAAVIATDAMNMRVPPVHAKVGPRVFPYVVSSGMAVAGAVIAWQAWRRNFTVEEQQTDWAAVAVIAAGLVLHMNLLKPAGFVAAATILFLSVAFAFGSRRYLRDAAVGLALSAVAYLSFTKLLGLQLPAGLLAGLI